MTNKKNNTKNHNFILALIIANVLSCAVIIITLSCYGIIDFVGEDKKIVSKIFANYNNFRICKDNGYMVLRNYNYHDHIMETSRVKMQGAIDNILRKKVSDRLQKYFKNMMNLEDDTSFMSYFINNFGDCIKIYDIFFDVSKIDKYIKKPTKEEDKNFKWFNNNIKENAITLSKGYYVKGKYYLRLTEDQKNICLVMKDDYDTLKAKLRKEYENALKEAQESKISDKKDSIKYAKRQLESFDENWDKYVEFAKKVQDLKIPLEDITKILTASVNSKKAKNAGVDTVYMVKAGEGISICFLNSKIERSHYDDDGNLLSTSTVMDEFKKFNFDIIWQTSAK